LISTLFALSLFKNYHCFTRSITRANFLNLKFLLNVIRVIVKKHNDNGRPSKGLRGDLYEIIMYAIKAIKKGTSEVNNNLQSLMRAIVCLKHSLQKPPATHKRALGHQKRKTKDRSQTLRGNIAEIVNVIIK